MGRFLEWASAQRAGAVSQAAFEWGARHARRLGAINWRQAATETARRTATLARGVAAWMSAAARELAAKAPPADERDPEVMAPSLASFAWRYSKRDQLILLIVTFATFPLLYLSLELPKLIINDAISAESDVIEVWGMTLDRVEYLLLLCFGFLGAVLGGGLLKMQLNTMKGVVAERLLRRFRFQLISRTMRFPLPYFQRTSQGELISMVTAEAEPLSGGMGDLVAQPVFQAGQMLTIVAFLFIQNVWLGLAATALIPLQAWLIPMLQVRINRLHKARVQEVRRLSARFGETIAGIEDLRVNNGSRHTLADFSARLGRLFSIRHAIYRKKFFLKFLNNFITQVTPFFFFSIGGYLAIQGDLTVGALVAALAAYKDLSTPWRELLTYVTQIQELSLRYRTITEQFGPSGMMPAPLFEPRSDTPPHLTGDLVISNATVREQGGAAVLEHLNLSIPGGAMVAIQSGSASERRALAQLMSRAIAPNSGAVSIGGVDLQSIDQTTAATRIGVVSASPYLFNRSIWENVEMSLRLQPLEAGACASVAREGAAAARRPEAEETEIPGIPPLDAAQKLEEARLSGNPPDPVAASWLDPSVAGMGDEQQLRAWWLRILETLELDDILFSRGMKTPFNEDEHPELAQKLVRMRTEAQFRVRAAGLDRSVHWFHPDRFNPGLAIAGNLLFAAPKRKLRAEDVAQDERFLPNVREMGLEEDLFALGCDLLTVITGVFGRVGASHPLFQRLGLGDELFAWLQRIAERRHAKGAAGLCDLDRALLISLPFQLTAEQVGQSFPRKLKKKILELRKSRCAELQQLALDIFTPLDRASYVDGLSPVENLLFGKVSASATPAEIDKLRETMSGLMQEAGLKTEIALLVTDQSAGIGGANLDPAAQERIAFVRAAIKRPDVLILDRALQSRGAEQRLALRERLRALLPETTLIFLEPEVLRPMDFDRVFEIEGGRLSTDEAAESDLGSAAPEASAAIDLIRKRRVFETCAPFRDLARPQLRLLAYASTWFEAKAGETVFRAGDMTDGAYILTKGRATLQWQAAPGEQRTISDVEPGRLVGDLSVILGSRRNLDMSAVTDIVGLRIGSEELREVIHSDAAVAFSLLQTVSGHLVDLADLYRDYQARYPDAELLERHGERSKSRIDPAATDAVTAEPETVDAR